MNHINYFSKYFRVKVNSITSTTPSGTRRARSGRSYGHGFCGRWIRQFGAALTAFFRFTGWICHLQLLLQQFTLFFYAGPRVLLNETYQEKKKGQRGISKKSYST